jgi:hypothetical protein
MGHGGCEGRVPSLMTAAVEREVSNSYFFSFFFDVSSMANGLIKNIKGYHSHFWLLYNSPTKKSCNGYTATLVIVAGGLPNLAILSSSTHVGILYPRHAGDELATPPPLRVDLT